MILKAKLTPEVKQMIKIQNDIKKKQLIEDYIYAALGSLIYALAFNLLIMPLNLYSVGFLGIAQLLTWYIENLIGIILPASVNVAGIIYYLITIPIFYMGYKVFSKEFAFKSIYVVTIMSIFFIFVPVPEIPIIADRLTACIIGGVAGGFGIGLILRARMASGGQDIIGMCCAKKFPDFSVGKVSIIINVILYAQCLFIYDVEMVVYSLIFSIVFSGAVDKLHVQNIKTSVLIFTKQAGIDREIMEKMVRGVTRWNGQGAYTGEASNVLCVVISKYEIDQLKKIVHEMDPHAFMIFIDECSVDGNFIKRL